MTERQPGWYWVKNGEQWECLHYSGCFWDGQHGDHDLQEIGPRIPTPDEDYVTMPRSVYDMICSTGKQAIDRIDRTWSHGELSDAPKPGGE